MWDSFVISLYCILHLAPSSKVILGSTFDVSVLCQTCSCQPPLQRANLQWEDGVVFDTWDIKLAFQTSSSGESKIQSYPTQIPSNAH
mmetsp:Transcript_381/g.820  ORF Transcript_381/g.820 Transcript_381/m.820 type:complete len:87 (-) Transcript_381:555-815(-)